MGEPEKYGFIGGGNMGEALIKGPAGERARPKPRIFAFTSPTIDRAAYLAEEYGVHLVDDNAAVVAEASLVVLAVKPQTMDAVLAEIGPVVRTDQLVVSIAAGHSPGAARGPAWPRPPR